MNAPIPTAGVLALAAHIELTTAHTFVPEHVGGPEWVLRSDDSRGTWIINGDHGLVLYKPGAWDLGIDADEALGGEWQVPEGWDTALADEEQEAAWLNRWTTDIVTEIMGDPEAVLVRVEIRIDRKDFAAGWGEDEDELGKSIEATLFELIGDDGGAYRPDVHLV